MAVCSLVLAVSVILVSLNRTRCLELCGYSQVIFLFKHCLEQALVSTYVEAPDCKPLTYLHALSPGTGPPHAILRLRQKTQARAVVRLNGRL